MNANTAASTTPPLVTPAPRFDAKFIEEHRLMDRYLEHKLPPKGAREFENWCRANTDYVAGLKLAERAQASLQLLEACGRTIDLTEQKPPWWKSPYALLGSGALAMACLLGFSVLFGKYVLLRHELEDTRTRMRQGSLVQPATTRELQVTPDRAAGLDKARIAVSQNVPQLIDLRIDMGYSKEQQFRMIVDKQDQGRALVVNNLIKDSNGELRLTFNTTGLTAGHYTVRLDALPFLSSGGSPGPSPAGWLTLEVR